MKLLTENNLNEGEVPPYCFLGAALFYIQIELKLYFEIKEEGDYKLIINFIINETPQLWG